MDVMQLMQARGVLALGASLETVEPPDPLTGFEEVLDQIGAEVVVDGVMPAMPLPPVPPAPIVGDPTEPTAIGAVEVATHFDIPKPLPTNLSGLTGVGGGLPEQQIETEAAVAAPSQNVGLSAVEGQADAVAARPESAPLLGVPSPTVAGNDPLNPVPTAPEPVERRNVMPVDDRAKADPAALVPATVAQTTAGAVQVSVPTRGQMHLQSRQAAAALRIEALADAGPEPELLGAVQAEGESASLATAPLQPGQPALVPRPEFAAGDTELRLEKTETVLMSVDSEPAQTGVALRDAPPATQAVALPPHAEMRAANPEQVTRQVAQVILRHAEDRAEVLLEPAELGRLQFEIRPRGDGVQILVMAERPETMDLLRRHADLLLRDLQSEGFSGSELGFGSWSGQDERPQGPARFDATSQTEPLSDPTLPTFTATPSPRNAAGGLDMRL